MPISKARLKISDYNENRKSNLRQQERRVRMVSLSLTSMVDMFAILVIFLLANSGTLTEWVQVSHGISLPQAKAADVPAKSATLQIAADMIYGDDKPIQASHDVLKSVAPLQQWLKTLSKKDGYINVVAHEKLPFGIVKRIVGACQDAGFNNVNLAVRPRGQSQKTE
jgi:biopolymer transport protein ExbD